MRNEKTDYMEEIRSYGFRELATLFFPDSTPESASHQFKRCIMGNKKFYDELVENGYKSGKRILLPIHVNITFKYMGKPDLNVIKNRNK